MRKLIIVAAGAAALAGSAAAQPVPREVTIPAPETSVVMPAPAQIPLPLNGCVWAGRSFSDGAQFCAASKLLEICGAGKWTMMPSEACTKMPLDPR